MALMPERTSLPLLVKHPLAFARLYAFPLALLLAGATADAITTFNIMRRFGPETEVHLVQRIVFHVLGVTAGVPVAKAIQIAFVLLVAAWWRPWCGWLLALCGVLYGLAAVSNHWMLL
jgi:hypothetical protein